MSVKICNKCKNIKDISEFFKGVSKKDNLHCWCKNCCKEYQQESYQIHKEKRRAYARKYHQEHREYEREQAKKYRQTNPEYRKEYKQIHKEYIRNQNKEYRQTHQKQIKEYKQTHKEQLNKYYRDRRKRDINFKLACYLRNRQTDAIKNAYKAGSAVKNLGCSIEFLKQYLESLFQPGMTWDNWGNGEGKWNIDHKIALLSPDIDLSNREDYLKVSHYTNLQPMWAIDNIKKSNK